MPHRTANHDRDCWISQPTRSATCRLNSVTHNALTPTALTQLATPRESHRVLNHFGELPRSSQPLHCPHQPIPTKAYPTMARPAASNHHNATSHTRPPHIVNGPQATPTTPLTGTAKPPWRLQSPDHHRCDSNRLTTTSTLPGSFRAAEQHAHRHGRDKSGLPLKTVSNTKRDRRPCPVQQLVRLPRRPITLTIPVS